VFADDTGRLWSASHTGEILVFTCISDGRQSSRAIEVMDVVDMETPPHVVHDANDALDPSVDDETLRVWLNAAPRIGTLP